MTEKIGVFLLDSGARMPKLAYSDDACFDLYSCEDVILATNQITKVRTGLIFEIPKGFFLDIRPRSGLASKGVFVANSPGTIDSGYRGEVLILLYSAVGPMWIDKGSRIAQARLERIIPVEFEVVDSISETERGVGGFGSTGL